MNSFVTTFRKNQAQAITLAVLLLLFVLTLTGMSLKDWVITLLRGLSVGSITFLVAAGFSLIFGLMDVLNLAHGTLFMIGAYVGWTVLVRPDTFVDLLTPVALLAAAFVIRPLLERLLSRFPLTGRQWPWVGMLLALVLLFFGLSRFPITAWNPLVYENSPATYSVQADQGNLRLPAPVLLEGTSPWLVMAAIFIGGSLAMLSLIGFERHKSGQMTSYGPIPWKIVIAAALLIVLGFLAFAANGSITYFLVNLDTTYLFFIALLAATLTGVILGGLMESTLIRPLYSRPIYQLMLTFGLSFIGIEVVRSLWGLIGFTMPKPSLFIGSGEGCPATSLAGWLENRCSTILVMGGRVRTYNEIFITIIGIIVLVGVWLLLQRTRLGMVIRAGVQDSEMVEALGINVRRVFTLVFALGVGLAALGGVLAGPSMGLNNAMGESLLLNVLIALAIGGLTSYPGAAVGSLIVGLLQQFIIKYGQIGIQIPFLSEPFKPSPPLVPASTVLLMVIILLVMPRGLFGKKE